MATITLASHHPSILPSESHREDILVVSDTHFGAPYADREEAEIILNRELAKPNTRICVLNGDIYEGVNLPIKDLPRTEEEADQMRTTLVKEYAQGKWVEMDETVLRKIPGMHKEELATLLRDIDDKSMRNAQNHPSLPLIRGDKHEFLSRNPEKALKYILEHTRLQEDALVETFDEHMKHLRELVIEAHPNVRFHYIIGNHERMPAFIKAVTDLSDQVGKEHLTVHDDYVKIGDALFVHGDQQLNPKKYHIGKPTMYDESYTELNRSFAMQVIHDYGNKIVPELLLSWSLHTPKKCAQKIVHWLQESKPEALAGVKQIFSGHTHCKYDNFLFSDPAGGNSYSLSNTGASIVRLKWFNKMAFNPIRISMNVVPPRAGSDDTDHVQLDGSTITKVERIMSPGQETSLSR